jgi:hypothetical protein
MKKTPKRTNAPSQGATPQRSQSLLVPTNGYYDQSVPEEAPVDDEGQDPMLHPPLWLFILGGIEIIWGAASNIFQVVTSFTGILGWQNHELVDKYGYAQAMELSLNRSVGLILVATVLSIGAQIGIQAFTQQISRQWKEKRVLEHESTKQALVEIVSGISIAQLYGYASILVCVWSDYMYVTQIDNTGSLGSYILMSFWALILGCSSTYVLMDGIQRFWSGTLALRAWALWQDALKAHFEELARQYQH